MKEFSITVQENGYALLTKNAWNPDYKKEFDTTEDGEKIPRIWLYEKGMKVVTKFGEVVTIEAIRKSMSKNGFSSPKWRILADNAIEYWASELAGILVRDNIPPYEVEAFIQGL